MNLRAQIELTCGGPGSGRHSEYGNFTPDRAEPGKYNHYRGNNATVTFRQDGKGGGSVSEGQVMGKENTVFQGPESNAREFMQQRYGIGKEWGTRMPDQPMSPYRAAAAGGQTDTSSMVGRKYYVQDNPAVGYGHVISEHDNPDDAERASLARPNSKVTSRPLPQFTPEVRDRARQRLVKTNPDVD